LSNKSHWCLFCEKNWDKTELLELSTWRRLCYFHRKKQFLL